MTLRGSNTPGWYSSVEHGKRPNNEDTCFHGALQFDGPSSCISAASHSSSSSASSSTNGATNVLVAGCFDGHGGDLVSKYLAQHMTDRISSQLRKEDIGSDAAVAQALTAAFSSIDRELKVTKKAHLVGSTAVVALVTTSTVHICSCGDSRAIICRGFDAVQPVQDHTPLREDERARIQRLGGHVFHRNGVRVMGALAMSRAVGDHALRPYGVTADPDVAHYQRRDGDDYLLLASDGLWNVLTNKDVACIVQLLLVELSAVGVSRQRISSILPKILTRIALQRGSTDNITVVALDIKQQSSTDAAVPQKSATQVPAGTPAGLKAVDSAGLLLDGCRDTSTEPNGSSGKFGEVALQRLKQIIKTVSASDWDSSRTAEVVAGGHLLLEPAGATVVVELCPSVGGKKPLGQQAQQGPAAVQQGATDAGTGLQTEQQQMRWPAISPQQHSNISAYGELSAPGGWQTAVQRSVDQTEAAKITTASTMGSALVSPFEVAQQFVAAVIPEAVSAHRPQSNEIVGYGPLSLISPNISNIDSGLATTIDAQASAWSPTAKKRRLVTTSSAEQKFASCIQQPYGVPSICTTLQPAKVQRIVLPGAEYVQERAATAMVPLQSLGSWPVQDSTWIAMQASA